MGRAFTPELRAQSLNSMSCGHLSAPKASRSGFGLPWNAKRAGLLVWPLVIVPPKRVASCGNRSRLTIANARYAKVTSGSPMRRCCHPSATVRLGRKQVEPRISNASPTPYANAVPIWCAEHRLSVKTNTGTKCASAFSLITTISNWNELVFSHPFSSDHY